MSHVKCATKPLYIRRLIDLSASPSLFFFSFALHENSRDLHTYTRQQKKEGCEFDGELDNFQEPKLSSLWKLVRGLINLYF